MKILLLVFIGVFFFSFFYSGYLFYLNTHLPRHTILTDPSTFNIKYEDVTLTASEGIMIKGWFLPVFFSNEKKKENATLILCHGFGTNKSDLIELAAHLHRSGYNVFMFDFRGHGSSGGKQISLGYKEQEDLRAVVSYLFNRPDIDKGKLGVFGLSMGAAVSILTASKDKRIKAVVSDSSYISLLHQAKADIKSFYNLPLFPFINFVSFFYRIMFLESMSTIAPIDAVKKISPRPILFIASELDNRMPVAEARMLYKSAESPKEIFVVPGAAHGENLSIGGEVYKKRVSGFFNKYL